MKELIRNLKISWKFVKAYKRKLILYILCNMINIVISIIVPVLSARVIIHLTSDNLIQLLSISTVILFVEILRNVMNYFARYFSQIIYRETFTNIQSELGREILKLKNSCIDQYSSGLFIQRLTNDTSKIAEIFNVLNMYLTNIITDLGIFVAIFIINKIVFIYLVFMVIVIYYVEHKRVTYINEKDKIYRKHHEKVSGFVGELVRGIRDIKMLNAEDSFMKELNHQVVGLNQERYEMSSVDRNYTLLRGSFLNLFDTGMIFLLVILIVNHNLAVANALVVHNYMGRVTSIVNYFSMLLERIKDFNLSSSRIFSILDSEEFEKETFGTKHVKRVNGDFSFSDVSFGYKKDQLVLQHVNFQVKANETVAFVGKSGAGKTTIFSLLCKMYDHYDGQIMIDGVDIRKLDKESIRGNITVINQNPYIFNLSIRDNLKLVKEDLEENEMKKACQLACLDKFIESLPDGYDTIIGEGGVNLSGGQKQRLAIARALIQKTEIILFDEATSALDNETQASIQKAIDNLKKDYTILIIAHRLSTIIHSDRILFLNHGKIEAVGTHKELLRTNKNYKNLYEAELRH